MTQAQQQEANEATEPAPPAQAPSTQQDLSRHSLTSVPPSLLKKAASLEELDLGDNQLSTLPPSLFSLPR